MKLLIGCLLLIWLITILLAFGLGWAFLSEKNFLICVGSCLFFLVVSVDVFLITGGK